MRNTDDLIGVVFDDRYEITDMVGQGGMATVYRAIHRRLDKVVALKVMSREVTHEEKQIKRFTQEAKSCSRLQHPNIIRVFDYGQSGDGLFFIAMELLEGPTLAEVIRKEFPISGQRACLIMKQVCDALQAAHDQGIIHRDLKPDNIMLSDVAGKEDFVKILDFGIAKVVNESTHETLTQTGYICGTPLYISPEQSLGKQLDGRADIYSVGVILFELLAGRQPFVADTAIALVMKHIHDTPPRVRAIYPEVEVSNELEDYIYRLLSKDRSKRPETAVDVAADLMRLSTIPPAEGSGVDDSLVPTAREIDASEYDVAPTMAMPVVQGTHTVVAKKVSEVGVPDEPAKTQVRLESPTIATETDDEGFSAEPTVALSLDDLNSTVALAAEDLGSTMAIEAPVVNTDRVAKEAIKQNSTGWMAGWALLILLVVFGGAYSLGIFADDSGKTEGETVTTNAVETLSAKPEETKVTPVTETATNVEARELEGTPVAQGRRGPEPVRIGGGPGELTPPAQFGILIETKPSRANVVIRDMRVGKTPYTFQAGPKTPETSVIVTRRGYFPQTWTYKPSGEWPPGQNKVKLVLKRERIRNGGGGGGIKWE